MQGELSRDAQVGKYRVGDIIDMVQQELSRWKCENYMHITRALGATQFGVVRLQSIFSKPTQEQPVPTAVVCVYFFFHTESGRLTYQFEQESVLHTVGGQSLAPGRFEKWLDRIIGDKLQVRQLQPLATPFEASRLVPPAMPDFPAEVQEESVDDEAEVGAEKPGTGPLPSQTKAQTFEQAAEALPLSTLLVNIFDAADEEDEYELTHKEVSDLLYATPLGLTDWDIKLLLTTATERDTGRIEYKPFVAEAPGIIEALRGRRADFDARCEHRVQVGMDAIELCYGEEIEEVARAAREAFAAVDTTGRGELPRSEFRRCLVSRCERFSSMEVQMLMQMCKEDDFGMVPYDEFNLLLQQLRIDALHNAVVETKIEILRVHLIQLSRNEGFQDTVIPIWDLRILLLSADQLCLSRMQIHVILMVVHPDEHGYVDFEYFLRVCCTVIPHMFDAFALKEKAEAIAKEKADELDKKEMEELQGLQSSLAKRRMDEEDQEDAQANAPDRDAVEKALIHVCNVADEKHRQQPTLDVRRFLEAMRQESVQACQLSDPEMRGLIAEAEIDNVSHEIAYVEHIKTWVPIVFELRKSRVYDGILNKDWGFDATHLVSLAAYEEKFPTYEGGEGEQYSRPSSAASQRSTRSARGGGRRPSSRPGSRPGSAHKGQAGGRQSFSRQSSAGGGERGLRRKGSFRQGGSRPGSQMGGNRRSLSRAGSVVGSRAGSPDNSDGGDSVASRRGSHARPTSRGPSSRGPSRCE